MTRATAFSTWRRAVLGVAFLLALGCESGQVAPRRSTDVGPKPTATAAEGVVRVGAPIESTRRERLATVLKNPADFAGQTFVVEGNVRRACSRKGCWMELAADATANSPTCRVTFKDYAFFVPTDSAGRMAKVQGTLELVKLKARHVEHLAEEGATLRQKAADGTAEEVHVVATGVELRRPST